MQTKLLREIKIALPNLRKSEVRVAEYILNKPSAIIELTTAQASKEIGVSEPTLIRFCKAINFEGATGLWKPVQQHLSNDARIVVVGSQLGTRGAPHCADYSASKAALAIWARSLAQEVGPEGKRVNVLAPGYVDTAILAGDSEEKREFRENEVPLKRVGSPEDMASTISFLVGKDSSYITGAIIHVNGGLYLP